MVPSIGELTEQRNDPDRYDRGPHQRCSGRVVAGSGVSRGVVGVVISGFQIYQSTQSATADLEIAMTPIGGPEQIAAVGYDQVAKEIDLDIPVGEFKANPIDLTLKNNGGQPSLITKVAADVKHYEVLKDCTRSGAGPAGITAEYTFKIPTDLTMGGVILGKHPGLSPAAV